MWRYSLTALRAAGLALGVGPGLGFGEMGSLYLRWRLRRWRSMASTEPGVAAPPGLEEAEAGGGVPYSEELSEARDSASSSESERSRSSRLCEPPIAAAAIRVSTREAKSEGSVREFEIWEWCVGSGAVVAGGVYRWRCKWGDLGDDQTNAISQCRACDGWRWGSGFQF
jgi:hypothetical protein